MVNAGDHDGIRSQLREIRLLDPGFIWSREHLRLRYRLAKERLKRAFTAGAG